MKEFDIPKEYRQHVVDEINRVWPEVDTDGSGEVDIHELEAAMGGKALAETKRRAKKLAQKGPTPADIIDACDANGSGGID